MDQCHNAICLGCCGQTTCEACIEKQLEIRGRICPFCRRQEFRYGPNLLVRRGVEKYGADAKCAKCGERDSEGHDLWCKARRYICPVNDYQGTRDEFFKHLNEVHYQELAKNSEKIFLANDNEVTRLKRFCQRVNCDGLEARMGATGKFYCMRKMDQHNLHMCGPRGGFNCRACMQLDLDNYKLKDRRGYLVNPAGALSKQSPSDGRFHCGRRSLDENCALRQIDPYCGPDSGPQCAPCTELQKVNVYYMQ